MIRKFIKSLRTIGLFNLASCLILMLFAQFSKADWYTIPFNTNQINPEERTHVMVSSNGNDLGYASIFSMLSRAQKIADVFPKDQILLVLPQEGRDDVKMYEAFGFKGITVFPKDNLDALLFFDYLKPLQKIASIHYFGHGAISEGVFMGRRGDRDHRWYPSSKQPEKIVGHFTDDAFATLNGCNTGHIMAAKLSKVWQIPVAGALVGTHFESLMPNGKFTYMPDAEVTWSKTSLKTLMSPKPCYRGCIRLRPDNYIYTGHYGTYQRGLPFYKMFCDEKISEANCLKGMALNIVTSVSPFPLNSKPTFTDYHQAVLDFMCPIDYRPGSKITEQCMQQLVSISVQPNFWQIESPYSPFRGPTPQCNFQSCYLDNPVCDENHDKAWACAKKHRPPAGATTFVEEYKQLIKAYSYL